MEERAFQKNVLQMWSSPGTRAPGDLGGMQIWGSHSRPTESEILRWSPATCILANLHVPRGMLKLRTSAGKGCLGQDSAKTPQLTSSLTVFRHHDKPLHTLSYLLLTRAPR